MKPNVNENANEVVVRFKKTQYQSNVTSIKYQIFNYIVSNQIANGVLFITI